MNGEQQPTDSQKKLTERLDLDFALRAAGLGVWELDPATNLINWDERCRELFGLAKDTNLPFEQAIGQIHPDDVSRVDQAIRRAMNPGSGGIYDETFRTISQEDGRLRWVRFQGRAYFTRTGVVDRFSGIGQDVTEQVMDRMQLAETERQLQTMIEQAPAAIALFSGQDMIFKVCNESMLRIIGKDKSVIGKPMAEAVPELKGQGFIELQQQVYRTGEPMFGRAIPATTAQNGILQEAYYDFTYSPLRHATGDVWGVMVLATDVTPQVIAQQAIESSAAQLRSIVQQTPAPTLVLRGDTYRIDQINQPMLAFMGRGEEVVGQPLLAVMPELAGQFAWQQAQRVYQEGIDFDQPEVLVSHARQGVIQDVYYNISYRPLRESGQITGMIQVAIDVTEQVLARQKLADSEARFRSLIEEAPVATCLFVGQNLVIEIANELMITFFGRGRSILNKPIRDVLTNTDYDRAAITLLEQVFATGEPYMAVGAPADLTINGLPGTYYFDLSLKPLQNADGEVYAVLQTAVDVTGQVLARRALEDSKATLQSIIDLAELGSYTIDLATNRLIKSPRVADWYGLPEWTDVASSVSAIVESDQQRVGQVLADALQPGSTDAYQVEYTVSSLKTGHTRILRTNGQIRRNSAGQAIRVDGTVMDITSQRELQQELERQVQQRTAELAAANERLASLNNELVTTNEDLLLSNQETVLANQRLAESNYNLTRSNDNLAQFAYIASHDLQEPLRKIQQFGDVLKTQHGEQLGESVTYLERMQSAAARMSTLIKDLLTYSRISTWRETVSRVPLEEVVAMVLGDLELRLGETGAVVDVARLPIVSGDRSQLEQLFQNLLSNALKFHRPGVSPVVHIGYRQIAHDLLPRSVKPPHPARLYHCIEVTDNGIGFDGRYVDRIFQVFQRLHGKSQYPGTGIGLAICEKVMANHGGAITAISEPGQGATFRVYFPDLA